jgi:hypothetical protein
MPDRQRQMLTKSINKGHQACLPFQFPSLPLKGLEKLQNQIPSIHFDQEKLVIFDQGNFSTLRLHEMAVEAAKATGPGCSKKVCFEIGS